MVLQQDDEFNEIECFDAFMEIVAKHPIRQKPSEIEAYINDCKSFFRGIYNLGVIDGFNASADIDYKLKNEL